MIKVGLGRKHLVYTAQVIIHYHLSRGVISRPKKHKGLRTQTTSDL